MARSLFVEDRSKRAFRCRNGMRAYFECAPVGGRRSIADQTLDEMPIRWPGPASGPGCRHVSRPSLPASRLVDGLEDLDQLCRERLMARTEQSPITLSRVAEALCRADESRSAAEVADEGGISRTTYVRFRN